MAHVCFSQERYRFAEVYVRKALAVNKCSAICCTQLALVSTLVGRQHVLTLVGSNTFSHRQHVLTLVGSNMCSQQHVLTLVGSNMCSHWLVATCAHIGW